MSKKDRIIRFTTIDLEDGHNDNDDYKIILPSSNEYKLYKAKYNLPIIETTLPKEEQGKDLTDIVAYLESKTGLFVNELLGWAKQLKNKI